LFLFKRKIISLILISLLTGCGASSLRKGDLKEADYYFERGQKMLKKKDYVKAIESFQTIVESFSTSEIVDKAQFYLAESHFMGEEYLTAALEYERVYQDYPSSNYAPEAQYKKALCYFKESPKAQLDQENTNLAIDEFNRFVDNYPQNTLVTDAQKKIEELREKLAYKDYLNAQLYLHMKQYEAAIIYFEDISENFPRTEWYKYSQIGLAQTYFKQKRYEKAREILSVVVNNNDNMEIKKKASELITKIDNKTAAKSKNPKVSK